MPLSTDSTAKYKKSEGWCSKGLLRNYLYVFNFFLLIGGLVVLAVGILSVFNEQAFIFRTLISNVSYSLTSYLLIWAGIMVLFAVTVGFCGIRRSDRCFLLIYILILLLIFLLEAKAGILAYFYRSQTYQELKTNLNDTFANSYGYDDDLTVTVDEVQRKYRCCGVLSFEDWSYSKWKLDGLAGENSVPDSCCKTESQYCGIRYHPSNIYYVGCLRQLSYTVKEHLGYLAIAGLGFCVLPVVGIIFSSCLYIKLKTPEPADL